MKFDLHTHSTCSDGSFSPHDLITHAKESALDGLAITDHDTIAAYPDALEFASSVSLSMITGVELSCVEGHETVHILGYAFDPMSPVMLEKTSEQRLNRLVRNRQILEKLRKYNIFLEESDIAQEFHPQDTYGRVHIAQAMVKKGYVTSVVEAFKKFIGNDKPCYVEGIRWSVEEGIQIIKQAGGLAVLAHPHLIASSSACKKILERPFDGIEAFYSRSHAKDNEKWVKIAESKGLFVTGGSDFHGAVKPDIKLGCSFTPEPVFKMLEAHFYGH